MQGLTPKAFNSSISSIQSSVDSTIQGAHDAASAHYEHHNNFANTISSSLQNMDGVAKAWAVGETALVGYGMAGHGIVSMKTGIGITLASDGVGGVLGGGALVAFGIEQTWYGMDMFRGALMSLRPAPKLADPCK